MLFEKARMVSKKAGVDFQNPCVVFRRVRVLFAKPCAFPVAAAVGVRESPRHEGSCHRGTEKGDARCRACCSGGTSCTSPQSLVSKWDSHSSSLESRCLCASVAKNSGGCAGFRFPSIAPEPAPGSAPARRPWSVEHASNVQQRHFGKNGQPQGPNRRPVQTPGAPHLLPRWPADFPAGIRLGNGLSGKPLPQW